MKIKVDNVSKSFKKTLVLNNINLSFENGKIYGLKGRNGSGKTVFLKILCGLYRPTTGIISIDNKILTIDNNYEFNIGALIESPKFYRDLTGYDNLKVISKLKNIIGDNEIHQILESVNLSDDKNKKVGKYSLGMKQKLGIAQALMEDPDIIILDEPFNGIEEKTVEKLKKLLIEKKEQGKIIIISSHIREDLDDLADEVICFEQGEVSVK